jgi:Fungal potassium channel
MSDIFTATTMLTTKDWSNQIQKSCDKNSASVNGCVVIPFGVAKWLFVGCIIFSFLLVTSQGLRWQ